MKTDPAQLCNVCPQAAPKWLVILDNAPTAALFVLGGFLLGKLSWVWAVVYLAYCAAAIVLFWKLICTCCHHYGTRSCRCGYGTWAARFFQRQHGKDFRQVFRRHIGMVFPCWFVPPVAAGYLLWSDYSRDVLYLALAFCVVGFVLIPAISKVVGCKHCDLKEECPWMKLAGAPGTRT